MIRPTRSGRIAAAAMPILALGLWLVAPAPAAAAERDTNGMLVLETDFGVRDGAVAAMKGVALGVDRGLVVHDLTHDIPPFDVWSGGYQLDITMPYWPKGTVFVAVVDPGVGTERGAVVARTKTGQYVVGPDNGLLTLVAEHYGVEAVRRIDEAKHRLPGSEKSFTFHGRDVFAVAAAKLASGAITFEDVGPALPGDVVRLDYARPAHKDGVATGMVPSLDVNFGNVWTNIDRATFEALGVAKGSAVEVVIARAGEPVFKGPLPYVNTFADVAEGEPLLYFNSDDKVAFAINYGDFAGEHGVQAGPAWRVELRKAAAAPQ